MAIAPDESIYIAWIEHHANSQADVMIAHFAKDQRSQGSPVRVNSQPGIATAWRGDPPTVAVATDNTVYVGWTARAESPSGHATDVFLSASTDRGQTFREPVKVNDDPKAAVHGMHSLAIANDGRIYVAWLDERNVTPVPMEDMKTSKISGGHHMESNRDVYLASSADGGRTFSANTRVTTNACPCCKTALGTSSDGRVYISWRQVLPGDLRHIAVSTSTDQGKTFSPAVIVSDDQWLLTGCPVSGSALAIEKSGVLHVLWYSAGKNGQTGLYSSESNDKGATFATRRLVAAGLTRGTPVLLAREERLTALWQTSDNGRAQVVSASFVGGTVNPSSRLVANAGELPAAVSDRNKMYVAFVAGSDDHRSVWLVAME
jgi:hypothetical protein